jgi:hypothetical protein
MIEWIEWKMMKLKYWALHYRYELEFLHAVEEHELNFEGRNAW